MVFPRLIPPFSSCSLLVSTRLLTKNKTRKNGRLPLLRVPKQNIKYNVRHSLKSFKGKVSVFPFILAFVSGKVSISQTTHDSNPVRERLNFRFSFFSFVRIFCLLSEENMEKDDDE